MSSNSININSFSGAVGGADGSVAELITHGPDVTPEIFEKVKACPQFIQWYSSQDSRFKYSKIIIDKVTMFGPNPGLMHVTTEVTFNGVKATRVCFIRGGAVGVLFKIRSKETGKDYVIYVRQPRNAVGKCDLMEIPAGMMDGATGTLKANGVAVKEIKEETGIEILKDDLIFLGSGYPSPGGCDEEIGLYLVSLAANDDFIMDLAGKHTGEIGSDEQITLGIAEYETFKTMLVDGTCKDYKAMSAIMLAETKAARKQISMEPTRDLTPVAPELFEPPMSWSFAGHARSSAYAGSGDSSPIAGGGGFVPLARTSSVAFGGGLASDSYCYHGGLVSSSSVGAGFSSLARTSSVAYGGGLARSSSVAYGGGLASSSSVGGGFVPTPIARTSSVAVGGGISGTLPIPEEDYSEELKGACSPRPFIPNGSFRPEEGLTEEEKEQILGCSLHGYPRKNPNGLWYTPNSTGYSTYSPPCNGCKDGQAESHLWMSKY